MTQNYDHIKSGFTLTGAHKSALCESCHVNEVFKGTPRECASCHNGLNTSGKPATHVATTEKCDTCHKSTGTWLGTKVNHSMFTAATTCSNCHNGMNATGKPATHIPTAANCETCHKSKNAWIGARVDHSLYNSATSCVNCHNGITASGKSVIHIPTTASCVSCHTSGYTSWYPAEFHRNISVITGCASCHATSAYGRTAKPSTSTHTGATVCENCHKSTNNWLSVQYVHTAANAVGTGTCDNCHNGASTAVSKSGVHIPVPAGSAKCDSCHKSQVSFNTSVTMNHPMVTVATCKSCHSGMYTSQGNNTGGALGKNGNHIPEAQLLNGSAMDCKACHTSKTAWLPRTMQHNNSMGNGVGGYCKTCHATGTTYQATGISKKALNHKATTAIPNPTDCSQSGCHKPLGTRGTSYSKWD